MEWNKIKYIIYIMSICACKNQTTKARCTYPAKLGTIYCGVHKNCRENASNPQPQPSKIKVKPKPATFQPQVKPATFQPQVKPATFQPQVKPAKPTKVKPKIKLVKSNLDSFMETRIRNYRILEPQFKNLDKCLTENYRTKKDGGNQLILTGYEHPIIFDESKRIGSKSVYGEVYKAHNEEGSSPNFSAKIMGKHVFGGHDNLNEVKILEKLTKLALTGNYPNFPLMYTSLICDKPEQPQRGHKVHITDESYIVVISELADCDTLRWFKHQRTHDEYKSVILQMIYTIYTFHNVVKYIHDDLHLGNFLVHKIKPGGFFTYTINNVEIKVPNCGYLIVIWDFGGSREFNEDDFAYDYFNPLDKIIDIKAFIRIDPLFDLKPLPPLTFEWLKNIIDYMMRSFLPNNPQHDFKTEHETISSLPV
jgi:hypothetical protein